VAGRLTAGFGVTFRICPILFEFDPGLRMPSLPYLSNRHIIRFALDANKHDKWLLLTIKARVVE